MKLYSFDMKKKGARSFAPPRAARLRRVDKIVIEDLSASSVPARRIIRITWETFENIFTPY